MMRRWKSRSKADKKYIIAFLIINLVFYLLLIWALLANNVFGAILASGCCGVSVTYLTHVGWRK